MLDQVIGNNLLLTKIVIYHFSDGAFVIYKGECTQKELISDILKCGRI